MRVYMFYIYIISCEFICCISTSYHVSLYVLYLHHIMRVYMFYIYGTPWYNICIYHIPYGWYTVGFYLFLL